MKRDKRGRFKAIVGDENRKRWEALKLKIKQTNDKYEKSLRESLEDYRKDIKDEKNPTTKKKLQRQLEKWLVGQKKRGWNLK